MRRLLSAAAAAALLSPLLLLAPALTSPAGAASAVSDAVDPGTGTEYDSTAVTVPLVFPVLGATSYSDNWLACRSGCARMHMGQDLMGPKMSPLVAAFDGVVSSVSRGGGSGNYLVISADRGPATGWSAVYVHVNNDTPGTDDGAGTAAFAFPAGIDVGARVLAGQLVGWRGDSGNAETTGPHLHFELRKGWGWRGTVFNAYPSLRAARRLATPAASGPHPSGTLLRHPTGALFLLDGAVKRPVTAAVLAADGRAVASAVPMGTAESLGYRTGPPVAVRDGAVVRDPAGTTWLVT
ncbi:MAG: N-acetylmuramoyl-L-alanine amidase, partial [Frankiales bacterium]|nr:N-acetylmuramoyl-L-alanine amidase [Frankiales bacterium]